MTKWKSSDKRVRIYIGDCAEAQGKRIGNGRLTADCGTAENRNRRSVWTVPTKAMKEAHFAPFPMKLIRPCILAGCPEGMRVLDPFGGSGTTGAAAVMLNRKAVLYVLNPEYVEIAKRRVERAVDGLGLLR